jgi:hypothetical protein
MSWLSDAWNGITSFVSNIWDAIKNAVTDIWNYITGFFNQVWGWIQSAAGAVWTFVQDYWYVIVAIIIIIVAWYASPYIAAASAAYSTGEVSAFAAVSMYANAMYLTMADFAAMIHLEVLLALHQIAFIVSPAYRDLVSHLYGSIAQVSQALGWGAGTMYLLLANSRTLVIDASTTLGRPYDVAEITWFSRLNDFMKVMSGKMREYEKDPGIFLQDAAIYLEKPDQDNKSTAMYNIYSALLDVTRILKDSADTVTILRTDVDRLVSGLPEAVQKVVRPITDPISKTITTFIKETYDPAAQKISAALSSLGLDMQAQKDTASSLIQRLARPGQYLAEINQEDAVLAQEDQDMVAEISERSEVQKLNQVSDSAKGNYEGIIEGIDTWEKPRALVISPAPRFLTIEQREGKKAPETKSPFVGDY